MKNKLITTVLAGTIAITSVVGLGSAAFAHDANSSTNKKAPTAEQISQHQEECAQMQEERLSALVEEGKITQEQKDSIIQFRADNKPKTDPQDLSWEEREEQRKKMKTAFETFASENGINVDDVKPPKGPGGPGGPTLHFGQKGPGSPGGR